MSWESFKKWLSEESIKDSVSSAASTYSNSSAIEVNSTPSAEQYEANQELASELAQMETDYWATQATDMPDYSSIIPTSNGMEKQAYIETPESTMVAEATATAEAQKLSDLATLESDKDSDIASLNNEISYLDATKAVSEEELNEEIKSLYEAAQNSAINNGLTNSSIATNAYQEVSDYGSLESQKISNEYDYKLLNLQSEITKTETAYTLALESYDLTYAANLKTALASIKEEESQRLQEIRDYNTYVDQQQAAYTKERQAAISEMEAERETANAEMIEKSIASLGLGESIAPEDVSYRNSIYEKVKEFYTTDMDANQALTLINQNAYALKIYMGEELYFKLLEEISNAS